MVILNSPESPVKPLVMAKLNMAYLSSLKTQLNCCRSTCRCHHLGYSVPPTLNRTIRCQSTFVPRGPGVSNPTSFLRPALPMAPTRDDNARDKRSVLRPNPATFSRDFALYKTTNNAILWKRCLNHGKNSGINGLNEQSKFLWGPVSLNFCARRRVMVILNSSESLAKQLVMAKLNMAYLKGLKTQQNCCRPTCRCHHLGYPVPAAFHRTTRCRSSFGPRCPGLSNSTFFQRLALPVAPTRDDNVRHKRSVLRPNIVTFLKDFTLYKTTDYAVSWKRCLNYEKKSGTNELNKKWKFL